MALRRWTRGNKNELIVLTGAVYAFVSYLTASTLEILFLLDLARQNSANQNDMIIESNSSDLSRIYSSSNGETTTFMDRFNFDSIQTHLAISCLAITVLYFLLFIASLKLIVALILRSTFVILIWMCLMTTMYLPEFGLVIYVSIYCWGLETRNGQTELLFYLFRAILNILFILNARKLFKEWNFEKTFLRLKSSNSGYDSPYFISGVSDCRGANLAGFIRGGFLGGCRNDSLSTTINPLFSSSSLNLNSYDQMANTSQTDCSPLGNYRYGCNNDNGGMISQEWSVGTNNLWRVSTNDGRRAGNSQNNSPFSHDVHYDEASMQHARQNQQQERSSRFVDESSGRSPDEDDDGDNLTSCELDIEYRTLSHCRRSIADADEQISTNNKQSSIDQKQTHSTPHQSGDSYQYHRATHGDDYVYYGGTITSSTQSLDRLRYLRSHLANHQQQQLQPNVSSIHNPEQVILRPLRHRPFDYLYRPGSSSNINNNQ